MTDGTFDTGIPNQTQPISAARQNSLAGVSVEAVLYIALAALTLVLHLAALGDVPMSLAETRPALAAWVDTYPLNPIGDIPAPESASVYWAQRIGFALLGGSELAARVITALAGVALAFTPLLFRDLLKPTRALLLSIVLAVSPTVFVASRFNGAMIWALLLAVLALWALKQWWLTRSIGMASTAAALGVMTALLNGPSGVLLAVVWGGALIAAALWTSTDATREDDAPAAFADVRARLQAGRWWRGLAAGALLAALIATGFALNPRGLEMIGTGLSAFVTGFAPQADAGHAPALFVALFYEPLLVVFAVASVVTLSMRREWGFVERFAVAAALIAVLALLFYRGAAPQFALLLTVPLMLLASYALGSLFYDARIPFLIYDDVQDPDAGHLYTAPWGRYLVAVVMAAFMLLLIFYFGTVAHAWISIAASGLDTFFTTLGQNPVLDVQSALIWVIVSLLFLLIGHFLAAGVWGHVTSLQGFGIGLLVIMLGAHLSAGWYAGVHGAGSALEPWHTRATTEEYPLLRRTLFELARREQYGAPMLKVTAVEDRTRAGLTRDSLLGWALRDFPQARFVADAQAARGDEIIIAPQGDAAAIAEGGGPTFDLGGPYVGQDFPMARVWRGDQFQTLDVFAWMLQRRVRVGAQVDSGVILWVRQDIFDSVPFVPAAAGMQ